MKLICHRASLSAALQTVSGVVPTRTPKEILKNTKLSVVDGVATLIGTDQEVGIRYEIPGVESDTPGEVLLPTSRLLSILREVTSENVDFDINDSTIRIIAGTSEFKLSAEDPTEFPPVSGFDPNEAFLTVPSKALREQIRRTVFATDVESTRYALGGILLETEADRLNLAATDSRRLAVCGVSASGSCADAAASPVVPSKAMQLIERSISDDSQEVALAIRGNDVVVRSGRSTIYSRLVDGRFPKYADVIPQQSNVVIDFVVGPLYSAIRQAQIVTNEESRGVDFHFENGNLMLKSVAADVGESTIELPISYDYEPLRITFDPRYVADFLKILGAETNVKLHLIDGESAAVFRTDDGYVYVIMPLAREQ